MLPLATIVKFPKGNLELLAQPSLDGLVSFSQFGEDIVLRQFLHSLFPGSLRENPPRRYHFIDLGSFHPIRWSNTFGLYCMGWRGLCVDANPKMTQIHAQARPEDTVITTGISTRSETRTFTEIGLGAGSSIDPDHVTMMQRRGRPIRGTRSIECVGVMDLLRAHWPADRPIDYMNIDLEGIDEAIVLAMDWDVFRPRILSVELHENPFQNPDQPAVSCLQKAGYVLKSHVWVTAFFVDERPR